MTRFNDRVAIVTGAASGIGRATALRLAGEGAAVVIADLDAVRAGEVAKEICAAGGHALALEVDVTDATAVREMTGGQECGIGIDGFDAFETGDTMETFRLEREEL